MSGELSCSNRPPQLVYTLYRAYRNPTDVLLCPHVTLFFLILILDLYKVKKKIFS